MASDPYTVLSERLSASIPDARLIRDEPGRFAYGTDASFYRLTPRLVVIVETEPELRRVLHESADLRLPVTFRAAGTSLSGQAVSDSVLIVATRGWNGFTVNHDASRITVQPGVIGADVNARLARFGRKIGPDPASINSATIGGIAANNASGMCCGTAQNSYHTVRGMKIIFHDGTVLNTASRESTERFRSEKGDLLDGIAGLHQRIHADPALVERIKHKYRLKNTTGFSLNAFLDYTDPVEIIEHLMIGSEGTLGFIAEITYETLPDPAAKASALMLFPTMNAACSAAALLRSCPVDAVELMDRASLRSIQEKPGVPRYLLSLDEAAAALLVETKASSGETLSDQIARCFETLEPVPRLQPISFTSDPEEYSRLWNIRKGLFPSVGAMRKAGTTCIIEDIAVPLPRLAEAASDLQLLLKKHEYHDGIIFGHALEGNLHFVFSQDFNASDEIARYGRFIEDLTRLITGTYDGSLKAEHGTGRNMAPFVEREWGSQAYLIMKEIKSIFDPEGLLNPGVVINSNPSIHLQDLKPLPAVHSIIDKCIECGFCEIHCPSKELTITPRQRIALFREMSRIERSGGDRHRLRNMQRWFDYAGNRTCATDGLCSTACPVDIDTGKLIKELRCRQNSGLANAVAGFCANHTAVVVGAVRSALAMIDTIHGIIGSAAMDKVTGALRYASGKRIPRWNKYMPGGGRKKVKVEVEVKVESGKNTSDTVIYFPSCINRAMGISRDYDERDPVTARMQTLLKKAGYAVVFPAGLSNLCCGMAFTSKGFSQQGMQKARELESALLTASNGGEYPVVTEMSPCHAHMKETLDPRLHLYEPVEFILEFMLERLEFHRIDEPVMLHIPCGSVKQGLTDKFVRLAGLCSGKVVVPPEVECCGWAGDRGFTYPELNESALRRLRESVPAGCSAGYSTSRTCEIGLSLHSGVSYTSLMYLVDRCTTPNHQES